MLRGVVGSTVHGLANAGTDDRDEMGVCIEPPEYVLGLRPFEHWVFRTQPAGAPSTRSSSTPTREPGPTQTAAERSREHVPNGGLLTQPCGARSV
jgi:RNA repair pathway DNA polymerase beta family